MLTSAFNPLKTRPEFTLAGVYGKCMLKLNQIVFKGLKTLFNIVEEWLKELLNFDVSAV